MKLEILEKNHFYHLYNKGINGCAIFSNDENKSYFLRQLDKHLNSKISVFAYCLMDNHFHLVIRVDKDEKTVTQALSNFLNAYAKAYNKQENRTGSLFEKHFKRIRLENEEYLRNLILYVHLNPKNHLGLDFENYKFSSYQAFLIEKETKIKKQEVLEFFGTIENFVFCHKQKEIILSEKYILE